MTNSNSSMNERFKVLDGWRGISILLVLAAHLLPLGPKNWHMNEAIAASGMAIFFILSGFLITNLLIRKPDISNFLIRRFMRIVPLAWLSLIITFLCLGVTPYEWYSNLLFFANWPPMGLTNSTGHFWSLCVEVQFYLVMAVLFFVFREKSFVILPFICLGITMLRVYNGIEMAVNTYYRADEILAGCSLAIFYHFGKENQKKIFGTLNLAVLFILLIASGHSQSGDFNYLRPYIAMLLVGATLFVKKKGWMLSKLESRVLGYIASISYALYIIHGILSHTWLGQGTKIEIYTKRPLLFLATLILSHISTKYYESYWIDLGKKMTLKK